MDLEMQKWQSMLTGIKKKGRRRIILRKALASAAAVIILGLGILQFNTTEKKKIFPYSEEDVQAITFMNDAFYDDELGFIYKR